MTDKFEYPGRRALKKWAYYEDPEIERSEYDSEHPMPISYGIRPTHIDQNGDYLWEINVGDTLPAHLEVNAVERSPAMRDVGCDGCVSRHYAVPPNWKNSPRYKNKLKDDPGYPHPHAHCSANNPRKPPFLAGLERLPKDYYRFYGISANRRPLGGLWKVLSVDGTLRHASFTIYLELVHQ